MSSAVSHHRKCGLHWSLPMSGGVGVWKRDDDNDRDGRSMDDIDVETFLDDNEHFLEDYVRRKVHRSKLERWLFKPDEDAAATTAAAAAAAAAATAATSTTSTTSYHLRRQRSRSFTPLRKLSATRFEENGLSTPIIVTDVDGQPSFLRTMPRDSVGTTSKNLKRSFSTGTSQSLYLLLEEIIREGGTTAIVIKTCRGLQALLGCAGGISALLTDPSAHPFSGTMYAIDSEGEHTETRDESADRIMTGVISSKRAVRTKGALVAPICSPGGGAVLGAVRIECAELPRESEAVATVVLRFAATALAAARGRKEMRLELARSEVFLELAQTVFSEQGRIEPTITSILCNFLTMIECERCQILLTDHSEDVCEGTNRVFKRVFDLQRSDLDEDGDIREEVIFEGRFPINAAITSEVAATGNKINIKNLESDERFDYDPTSDSRGLNHHSMLCMPIRDPSQVCANLRILGVISLINKENFGVFTENDERFVEAFAIFCAMAIRNAAEFERAVVSEAKLKVAFEVMNYQASASAEEAMDLAKEKIPSAATYRISEFDFNYIGMTDMDTYKATIRILIDSGVVSNFHMDYETLCRWIMTVKKNYRNDTVKYHNWYHAFNVTQMMFCMLKKTGWDREFSKTELLGLLVACLSHDLDHRGTTNAFQQKSKNALATLYSSSTLERHHLNQCLLLLNIPGNRILENLSESPSAEAFGRFSSPTDVLKHFGLMKNKTRSQSLKDEYQSTLRVIERCILATDLAQHFRELPKIKALSQRGYDRNSSCSSDRHILQHLLMTASDLGACTKPWEVHFTVTRLISEEFWAQGDLERDEFDERPSPMMDREASLALVQIDFLDSVCTDVYSCAARIHPALSQLMHGCVNNKERWGRSGQCQEEQEVAAKGVTRNL